MGSMVLGNRQANLNLKKYMALMFMIEPSLSYFFSEYLTTGRRNCVFATNYDFMIPISLQPNGL